MTTTVNAPPPADVAPDTAVTGRVQRIGPERLSLAVLLVGTGVLYLWGLGASGYANEFYAAAVQAGTKSWRALFFGSFDSSNFITVDKPPASLWPMEVSGRLFGFSSWSMLAPQALEGVLAVWLLYAMVRRWFGHGAGLLTGCLLAVTPVAVLMFRFNNPDALMTLLIVLGAYCTMRAIENASTRWLSAAGSVMGLSFLAKGLQPFTVLPALALAYLVAAPTSLRRRLRQVVGAGAALVVGAGWWVLAVALTPASSRPYIGGSGDNTALGLAFGYNGLGRITGNESIGSSGAGGGARPGGGPSFSGTTGIGRLFNDLNGGQIAWLLPAALLALVALAAVVRGTARTDRTRAALLLFGGWLVVTGAVLSYAGGVIHTYYTVELAPAIAALVAIGAVTLWRRRAALSARLGLAAGVLVTGLWSYSLLHRAAGFEPWVADVVVVASVVAAALILPAVRVARAAAVAAVASLIAVAGGSVAYAVDTAATPHTGATPSAGPATGGRGFGGFGGRGPGGGFPGGGFPGGAEGGGPLAGLPGGTNSSRFPTGPGAGGQLPGAAAGTSGASGASGAAGRSRAAGGSRAAVGSGATTVSTQLTALLKAAHSRWSAATTSSMTAAPLELASGTAVMSLGGFNGQDDAISLGQFQRYVAEGRVRYFIAGGGGFGGGGIGAGGFRAGGPGGPGGGSGSSAISTWVSQHFTATTVGGYTVYDLSTAAS